jgi:hypothetical protein
MDEIVQLVTQKVGITQEQAKQAVEIIINYLKEKLPVITLLLDNLPTDSPAQTSKPSPTGENPTPNDIIGSVGDLLGSVGEDDKDE